jgi:flagellar hook-basal body complex protein FliE
MVNSLIGTNSIAGRYASIAQIGRDTQKTGFNDVLKNVMEQSAETVRNNEKVGLQQTLTEGDITKVAIDTAQVEALVTGLSAIRDKLVTAFQEVQKMQI